MINSEHYYEMNALANELRTKWYIDDKSPIDILAVLKNKMDNLTIIFMEMDNSISGASSIIEEHEIIFINSKHSYGRQRFSIAHELYHIEYDKKFITCTDKDNNENEKKADQFASCLLLPHDALINYEQTNNIKKWELDEIIDAEQYFQISHHALLWRLRNLEKISYDNFEKYKNMAQIHAKKRGYTTKLYEPFSVNETSMGYIIKGLEKVYESEEISFGKREEILLDVCRYDDVFF